MNIFGRPLFGTTEDNAILPWYWHSQNLDHRPGDDFKATGSKLMHGRAHLHLGDLARRHKTVNVEWTFRSSRCGVSLSADGEERGLSASIAFPPAALYLTVEGLPLKIFQVLGLDYETAKKRRDDGREHDLTMEKEFDISIHDWSLWWRFWHSTMSWHSSTPFWRHGSLNLLDILFGRSVCTTMIVEKAQSVLIPMPERTYRGRVTLERRTWSRPRWPFRGPEFLASERLGYDLKMDDGEQIPFPGKGESEWDCGEDALFGQSGPGGVTAAIAGAIQSVLRSREKYGGGVDWRPEPKAQVEA